MTSPTAKICGWRGAVFVVDDDAATVVGFEPRGGEIKIVDIAVAADSIEEGFAGNFLFAFEIGDDEMIGSFFDTFDLFVEAECDAAIAEMVAERFDHFGIGKFQKARSFFDERDAHAESGEHTGVLDADDAAADNDHGFGNFGYAKDLIAVDDGAAVEGNERRFCGLCAGSDDDVVGLVFGLSARTLDLNAIRIEEAGGAGDDIDAVAGELCLDDVDFGFDDVECAEGEVGHADMFLHAVIGAINALVLVAGEMKDGFANGLAGDGAGIDGGAADNFESLDKGGAFAEFGGLNGGALAGRPGTNDDEIVLLHKRGGSITLFDEYVASGGGSFAAGGA